MLRKKEPTNVGDHCSLVIKITSLYRETKTEGAYVFMWANPCLYEAQLLEKPKIKCNLVLDSETITDPLGVSIKDSMSSQKKILRKELVILSVRFHQLHSVTGWITKLIRARATSPKFTPIYYPIKETWT